MASVIEILSEEFKAIHVEKREREKHDTPLCAADFQDRFRRLSETIRDEVGLHYEITILILLYKDFERMQA